MAQIFDGGNVSSPAPPATAGAAPSGGSGSGTPKVVLVPFAPFVTGVGVGCGAANVSELPSGLVTLGWSVGAGSASVAVDFTVPTGGWTISEIRWMAYEVGASTAGTITAMYHNLWNIDPTGLLPGGEWISGSGNLLTGSNWTGVYRVATGNIGDCSRAIIDLHADGTWLPTLPSGTYWLETACGGSLSNGPWSPVEVPGSTTPNGLQSTGGGPFQLIVDGGGAGFLTDAGPAQDFLFQLEGSLGGSATTPFCTSKTSSLGCTPLLTASAPTAAKSGAPATALTAAPVPGGAGLPGILIYAQTPPSPPIATSFGFLCLSGFARAGAFPASPGGTAGFCNGTYTWNAAAIAAGTAGILVGDKLRLQAWYRDSGFPPPGNANLTHGIDGITIVP